MTKEAGDCSSSTARAQLADYCSLAARQLANEPAVRDNDANGLRNFHKPLESSFSAKRMPRRNMKIASGFI